MAMAYNTRPRKLWLSCSTRTLQALILSTVVLLAASTSIVVGTAEPQPPSSGGGGGCRHYRFELTHVDANLSLSSDELMRRAYDRSRLRAATLYGSWAADSPDSDSDSPVRSPGYLSKLDASYIIKFYQGKQVDKVISAVMDTGSNLIWTTQKECPMSETASKLPCCSPKCEQRANCGCSTSRSSKAGGDKTTTCEYHITYGGNKNTQTEGVLYEDKLTFVSVANKALPSFQSFEKIAIGCSTSTTVKFEDPSIKGIFGLGRSAQSLPGQLSFDKFSYCLNSYYKPDLPSYLLLTTAPSMATGATSGAAVATTGLLRNDAHKTRYFVDLQGISIGGTRLDVAMKSGGNMFVDTGASFTHLEGSVFDKLVETLDKIMKDKHYNKDDGRICYSPPSATVHAAGDSSVLPQMELHFAGSAKMVLPSDSYFWKASELCLAIERATTGMSSVLGNFQMQGIHMLFDTQKDELSFVPADCSKV